MIVVSTDLPFAFHLGLDLRDPLWGNARQYGNLVRRQVGQRAQKIDRRPVDVNSPRNFIATPAITSDPFFALPFLSERNTLVPVIRNRSELIGEKHE